MMYRYEVEGTFMEFSTPIREFRDRTSLHGLCRTMDRSDRNERRSLRLIQNAWERGRPVDELPMAWQRRRLSVHKSTLCDGASILRVYSGYLFIFNSTGKLITMINLPRGFDRKRRFDGDKRPVRHTRRFDRMNAAPVMSMD